MSNNCSPLLDPHTDEATDPWNDLQTFLTLSSALGASILLGLGVVKSFCRHIDRAVERRELDLAATRLPAIADASRGSGLDASSSAAVELDASCLEDQVDGFPSRVATDGLA
jgi:hypothetical protein